MTDNERHNMTRRMANAIAKHTTKERKENEICPDPQDFMACWTDALKLANPVIMTPRGPGRPPKTKTDPVFAKKASLK
jgi:hypothetical protein